MGLHLILLLCVVLAQAIQVSIDLMQALPALEAILQPERSNNTSGCSSLSSRINIISSSSARGSSGDGTTTGSSSSSSSGLEAGKECMLQAWQPLKALSCAVDDANASVRSSAADALGLLWNKLQASDLGQISSSSSDGSRRGDKDGSGAKGDGDHLPLVVVSGCGGIGADDYMGEGSGAGGYEALGNEIAALLSRLHM